MQWIVNGSYIGHMVERFTREQSLGYQFVGTAKPPPQAIRKRFWYAMHRDRAEIFAVVQEHRPGVRSAERVCVVQNGVEHWREVTGRRVDDLQDLSGRGLLFQCLARLGQEPGVLDRDDRLVGEIL